MAEIEIEEVEMESEEEEDNNILVLAAASLLEVKQKDRSHRFWVHPLMEKREDHGAYYTLVKELGQNPDKFQQYFRLTKEQFSYLEKIVSPYLVKKNHSRKAIEPKHRLAITLR